MNTFTGQDLLLNINANSSVNLEVIKSAKDRLNSNSNQDFKQEFNRQVDKNKARNSSTNSDGSKSVALDRNSKTAASLDSSNSNTQSKSTTEVGETLPISPEAGKFLAALSEDAQEEIFSQLKNWLAGLDAADLKDLQEKLEAGEDLAQLLPPELLNFLQNLQAQNPEKLDFLTGFKDLLASLANSDIKALQLASIQQPNTSRPELQLVSASEADEEGLKSAANQGSKSLQDKAEISADSRSNKTKNASAADNKINQLISTLNRTALSNGQPSATSGAANLNQLLEAAGQGLPNQAGGASAQTLGRFAAGLTTTPMMMQAANAANAQALANRISIMHSRNMQAAEMRLDPPNLGSVRIQLKLDGDKASIAFQTPNPQARELLENSLPRLREMLEAEGMQLAEASVSQEDFASQEDKQESEQNSFASQTSENDADIATEQEVHVLTQPLGLIDYYA